MTHFLNCILFSKYIQTHTSVHLLQLVFDTVTVAAVWSMHVFFFFFFVTIVSAGNKMSWPQSKPR